VSVRTSIYNTFLHDIHIARCRPYAKVYLQMRVRRLYRGGAPRSIPAEDIVYNNKLQYFSRCIDWLGGRVVYTAAAKNNYITRDLVQLRFRPRKRRVINTPRTNTISNFYLLTRSEGVRGRLTSGGGTWKINPPAPLRIVIFIIIL